MRLVCPNCAAQYEVGDDVIPASGRDVQCSNCGHTWLETPGETPNLQPVPEPVPAHQEPEPEPVHETEDELQDEMVDIVPDQPEPSRVDPTVADILNEEADREEAARAAEAAALESQTEMGLDSGEATDPDPKAQETSDRIARLKGEEATAAAVAAATRKEMLPDIEEINSTLRSSEERGEVVAPEPEEVQKAQKRGFRTGFFGVILLILILAVIYMFAPQIKSTVPALAGPIDSYTAVVDSGRQWLDGLVSGLRDSMQSAVDADQAGES